jgi:quercetin dioxygenase-like cupin family protein
MTLIPASKARRTETPNAVMTTLASPTLGAAGRSLWRVDMRAAQAGPEHVFDVEQIWTAMSGRATVEVDGERIELAEGDTIVISPNATRRVVADDHGAGFSAIVTAAAGARASLPDGTDRGVPAWIA